MKKTIILFLILGMLQIHLNLNAKNYYVSPNGNNTTGLTPATAFRTIQQAVNVVAAGDTVFVANGTYAGFDIRKNGTSASRIIFKAAGTSVVINQGGPNRTDCINVENANYITIDGFTCINSTTGNGIRLANADFCVVRNCKCDNNYERGIFTGFTDDIIIEHNICSNSIDEHGIYVSNSSDRPIIRYNECFGNAGCGIHLNGDLSQGEDGIIHDAQIYGNRIHDNNMASSINMDGVLNSVIYNNLIYNNHNCQGIVLFNQDGAVPSSGAKIFNNTIIVPSDGRWGVLLQTAGANINTKIYNNIIINLHSFRGCIGTRGTSQFVCNNNLTNGRFSVNGDNDPILDLPGWKALGFDTNSELAGTLASIFVNPNSYDYHLKSGSQAIDKGTNDVNSVVHNDYEGHTRPAGTKYDIGAYEYGAITLIEKNKPESFITITPNPSSDFFIIGCNNQKVSIRKLDLYDMNGRIVKSFEPQNILNIQSVPAGMYSLSILLSNNEVIKKKVVIY